MKKERDDLKKKKKKKHVNHVWNLMRKKAEWGSENVSQTLKLYCAYVSPGLRLRQLSPSLNAVSRRLQHHKELFDTDLASTRVAHA